MRKYKKEFVAIILLIVMFLVCSMSYAYAMSTPIPSVIITSENTSYENKEEGSWQVEKSAKWISKGKARVTFDVDTTLMSKEEASDIIFVVDTSGSMEDSKLDQVKIDSTNLINNILSNENNRIALIEFNSYATIHTNFINDKEFLINEINNLEVTESTNYYNAFLKVDELLQSYQKQDNREVVVMFLTDGYPYEGNPNQVVEYKYLKETYPYLTVNAIQYEMGDTIINQLKEVSDNQFIAYQTNLNDILSEASITAIPYEEFQIIDYIDNDYYTLNSVDDIKVSDGEVELTEENGTQKITWTIDNYLSGRSAKLTMDLSLKDEYIGEGGVYPTNQKEGIISKIENQNENVNSNLTPTLAEKYQIIYDGNAPDGSRVENIPDSEVQSVFGTVEITDLEPTCSGYIFQGWEIVTDGVKKLGSDYFVMPEENVTLRAKWSKIGLAKSMDGVVSEQGDPIMKGSTWWTSEYDKTDVTSIEIKTNTDIPDTAIYSWDASVVGDRSVMAYLEDDGSGNGTYKVTIGGRGGVIANVNSASLFEGFTNVVSINLNNFDTSNVTVMNNMFRSCSSLIELDLSNFDTSRVTSMSYMFNICTNLESLNISSFDTKNVVYMAQMFRGCNNLKSLNLINFDTSKVNDMSFMFNGCSNLTELNISNFNTSNVTTMQSMFEGCSSLTKLDLSNFNTSNVTTMSSMFKQCKNLTSLDVSSFNTSNVTSMGSMFQNCSSLVQLNLSNFITSSVTTMQGMFYNCRNLISLNLSSFDTSKLTTLSQTFQNCYSLVELNLSNFITPNLTNLNCTFAACNNLISLNISNFDTSKVTVMTSTFSDCSSLQDLNITNFNTSKVGTMSYMFRNCSSLTELNLSSFNTSNVTNMFWMFYGCSGLTNLDLSNFDTSNVNNMASMFYNCSNLLELDISSFNASSATEMYNMFNGCKSLTNLDLSSFSISQDVSMSYIFRGCTSLKSIDFRNSDFSLITNYREMFYNTTGVEVLVSDETARSWMQDKLGTNGTAVIATT